MDKVIKVTGKGKVSVKPDLIRIRIEIEGTENDYEKAVKASTEATSEVKDSLVKLGFDSDEVKTLNYSIQTTYESYQTGDRSWRRRFVGYEYNHKLKLEFALDNEKLGQVLYAIAHCNTKPEFSIEYTVADPEIAKDELLKNAISDSKHKAELLAEASGLSLDEIQSINYSWGEIEFISRPFADIVNNTDCDEDCDYDEPCCLSPVPQGYGMDVNPDDIDVSDTVTVIWSMK